MFSASATAVTLLQLDYISKIFLHRCLLVKSLNNAQVICFYNNGSCDYEGAIRQYEYKAKSIRI